MGDFVLSNDMIELAIKKGARNSASDLAILNKIMELCMQLSGMEKAEDGEGDMPAGKAITKRPDVNPKEGESQYGDVTFADEKNKKYPIDTAEHIRAAWNYISKDANAGKYDPAEVTQIKNKIVAAWKDKIDKAGPPSADKSLDLSYAKSLGLKFTDEDLLDKLSVKSIGRDEIRHYTMLWGDPNKVDVEREFFQPITNFWDAALGKSARPLTWDHMQDPTFKADPIIGKTVDWGDDDLGRWAVSVLDRNHKYRGMIDRLISKSAVGSSSDTAPQYIIREPAKSGAVFLKQWPWLATALTPTPAEPRMLDGTIEQIKSFYGLNFPGAEATDLKRARDWKEQAKAQINLLRLFTE